jgi:TetR/AcrR family transcriptional regulator
LPDAPQIPPAGRAEILAAATDLFGELGYDGVSVSAIAQKASTSKANVFHHFGAKEALYLEVMRQACGEFAAAFDELGDSGQGVRTRLTAFIERDLELMRAHPDRSHLIMREVLESGPCRGQALASEVFDGQFRRLVTLFEQGQAAGVLADDLPPALAATMTIACNVFLFQSKDVLRHLPGIDFVDDPSRYSEMVSRVLLDGLSARPGTRPHGDDQ